MLYPKKIPFNFQRNGIYFMLFLMFFALVAYCFMLWQMIEISLATKLIVLRFLDTLMWIIPPALPIFFSVCQTIALIRLTKLNIFATDPAKVVVASDLTVMCFDKTGTLTQDSMEVKGYYDNTCKDIKQAINDEKGMKKGDDLKHTSNVFSYIQMLNYCKNPSLHVTVSTSSITNFLEMYQT